VEGAGGGQDLEAAAALLEPQRRASFIAASFALGAAVREEDALGERVPAEERAQLARGERVVDVGGVEQRRRLRRDRLTTAGWQWPRLFTARPAKKSR